MSVSIWVTASEYEDIKSLMEKKKLSAKKIVKLALNFIVDNLEMEKDIEDILSQLKISLCKDIVKTGKVGRPANRLKKDVRFYCDFNDYEDERILTCRRKRLPLYELLIIGYKIASNGYICKRCKKFKNKLYFDKNNQYRSGRSSTCHSCKIKNKIGAKRIFLKLKESYYYLGILE